MKNLFVFIAMAGTVLFSCKKRDAYSAHFFQTDGATKTYTLKIDGIDEGVLPYKSSFVQVCPEATDTTCLHLQLYEGKYAYEVMDNSGATITKGHFKVIDSSVKESNKLGSSEMKITTDCGIFRFGK